MIKEEKESRGDEESSSNESDQNMVLIEGFGGREMRQSKNVEKEKKTDRRSMKGQLEELKREADLKMGSPTKKRMERGNAAALIDIDDWELIQYYEGLDVMMCDTVSGEAERLIQGYTYELGYYSAIESDYKEPRAYREMMRRPEGESKNGQKE